MLGQERNGSFNLGREPIPKMFDLFVEILDRFSKLELCRKKESDGRQRFRARSRAKTSSAGADLIFPAL